VNTTGRTRRQPLVLIADHDPTTRSIVREILGQAGFDVIEADDGEDALRCYEQNAPDAVLLDIDLPYLNGFAVCKNIREREPTRKIPICFVSGLVDKDSVDRAYHVGATDFVAKPIVWPVLAHRIRYLLRASDALNEVRGLALALPDIVFVLDSQANTLDRVTDTDAKGSARLGVTHDMVFEDLLPENSKEKVQEHIRLALASGEPQIYEHHSAHNDVHCETRFVARDRQSVLAIVRDVTEGRKAELQIYDLAYYDQLTGLPNRQLFSKELDVVIESGCKQQQGFSILFVDLDHFKRINDTLGNSMGDALLKAVAARFQECLRSEDHVIRANQDTSESVHLARVGGDEFVIVLRKVDSEDAAGKVASRIGRSLAQPLSCEGHQFVVTPSIGIAIYPQDGETSEDLLMNADAAMYKAKAAGRNTFKFFSGTMKIKSLHRLDMENELRQAIDGEHFQIYYQPKVHLATWTIVGVEALLRWKHCKRGWISPADFVPVAEETGLILPLGKWVLQAACRQIGEWQHTALNRVSMSVNISPQQVYLDDLVAIVTEAVSDAGIRPELLDLEITESLLMRDIEATIGALSSLKDLGVNLSIDDFGTGYSSLSYLKRFPIDALKIDRSFVQDLHLDADDAAICAAILAMAHNLNLKVVAEGVEFEEQLDFLRRHNCEEVQGYLFSKPLPANEFEALFLTHSEPCEIAAT